MSHPTWVRGLKSMQENTLYKGYLVAPHMGAWIEISQMDTYEAVRLVAPHMGAWIEISTYIPACTSSPVAPHMGAWIEIKCQSWHCSQKLRRTPHGCVDWNQISRPLIMILMSRTPHGCVDWNKFNLPQLTVKKLSHPTWVRGLKYVLLLFIKSPAVCRTLHGCVDWNLHSSAIQYRYPVAPYTGACIEILTTRNLGLNLESRTLHGCVDWNIWRYSNYITWFRRTLHGCVDWNNIY